MIATGAPVLLSRRVQRASQLAANDWLSEQLVDKLTGEGYQIGTGVAALDFPLPASVSVISATQGTRRLLGFVMTADVRQADTLLLAWQQLVEQGHEVVAVCGDRQQFQRWSKVARQNRVPVRLIYFGRHRHTVPLRMRWSKYMRRRGGQLALWIVVLVIVELGLILAYRACEASRGYDPLYYEPKDMDREAR